MSVTVHQRLYGPGENEAMDCLPYLTRLYRSPRALKYTGIRKYAPG